MVLRKKECLLCHSSSPPLLNFPKDPKRMKTWLEKIKQEELLSKHTEEYIYNNGRLCALHFPEELFTSTLKKKLIRDALPTDLRDEAQVVSVHFSPPMHSTPITEIIKSKTVPSQSLVITPKTKEISRLRCKVSKMKESLFQEKEKTNFLNLKNC